MSCYYDYLLGMCICTQTESPPLLALKAVTLWWG